MGKIKRCHCGVKKNDNRNQNAAHIFPDDGLIAIIRSVFDLTASLDYSFMPIHAVPSTYLFHRNRSCIRTIFVSKKNHFDYHFAMAYTYIYFYHSQNTNIFILMAIWFIAFSISRFRFILSLVITAVCVRDMLDYLIVNRAHLHFLL